MKRIVSLVGECELYGSDSPRTEEKGRHRIIKQNIMGH